MSGYIYEFDVYQGKQTNSDSSKREFCLVGTVVDEMTNAGRQKPYHHHGQFFFSSVTLFEYLKTKNIYAVGIDRLGLPKLIDDKKMKRGDLDYQISDQGISFVKWKGNRSVHFLSNYYGNDTCKFKRRLKDGTKIDVTAPIVVKDYNGHMGGGLIKSTCYVLFLIGTGNRKNGATGFFLLC